MRRAGRRSSLRAKLALAVIAPAVLFLAVEGVLRLTSRTPKFLPDSRYIFRLETGGAWLRHNGTTINLAGYRGPEIEVPKPAGRFRILALGGSTTFGHDLRDEDTWPYILQQRLLAAGRDLEVINGGVPGWGIGHCLLRLRDDGSWIDPDLVIVYSGWNWPEIDFYRGFNPFPYRAEIIHWMPHWVLRSRVFLDLAKKINRLKGRSGRQAASSTPPLGRRSKEEILAAGVRSLGAWSTEVEVPVCIVLYPALVGRHSPDAEAEVFPDLLMDLWAPPGGALESLRSVRKGYQSVLATLESEARDQELVILNAAPAFEALAAEKRKDLFLDRIHLSPQGTRLLVDAIEEELELVLRGAGTPPPGSRDE